jgi:hypothetical protein
MKIDGYDFLLGYFSTQIEAQVIVAEKTKNKQISVVAF